MENSRLMIPLFYDGKFNREGCRMRAVLEKEISNGTQSYQLWRSAGKPDLSCPRAGNDRYILHMEVNGYLAPLKMTDFILIDICGFEPAAQKLYGGKEKRGAWINSLRESGGSEAVSAALAEERKEIERYGSDPARQTEYIQNLLNGHVSTYLISKENGGQTFPDFIGALVMNELAKCVELSAVYRTKKQAEETARQARAEEEEQAYCEVQNKAANQVVSEAIQIIRNGGTLKNETVTFYRSRYSASSYSIVNHLMRMYHVDVPLRTQGWINDKLVNTTIKDGKCEHLQYLRSKGGRCSQKFFHCMRELIQAVAEQTLMGESTDAA
ncbi:MAG: hypothetical protein K2P41_14370 [Lachnospiraceae bacterium]|nr:hypothetical protein [Lachnospiraceae bacterium]